jgi:hypothetical protein
MHDTDFVKTLRLTERSERQLLPLVRTYLLGYFGYKVAPETWGKLPGGLSGWGRIDFVVDNVAIELAVRKRRSRDANLSTVKNSDEIKKLMKFDGLSVLVLFDFSEVHRYTEEDIESFRKRPSLGKGAHAKSPFTVLYYYWDNGAAEVIKKHIRVR